MEEIQQILEQDNNQVIEQDDTKNSEQMIEIQTSYVAKFLKQQLGNEVKISSKYRSEFSKCLSIFIFYFMTIVKQNQNEKKRKITKQDLFNALNEIGFEDLAEKLQNNKWVPKQLLTDQQNNKKRQTLEEQEIQNENQKNFQEKQDSFQKLVGDLNLEEQDQIINEQNQFAMDDEEEEILSEPEINQEDENGKMEEI